MLFHITQTHGPDHCPVDSGGQVRLFAKPGEVAGLKLVAMDVAPAEHTLYYIVEATDYNAVVQFLLPGFKRCQSQITPVAERLAE